MKWFPLLWTCRVCKGKVADMQPIGKNEETVMELIRQKKVCVYICMHVKKWGYGPEKIYLGCSWEEQSNPAGAVDQGGIGFELFLGKPFPIGLTWKPDILMLKPSPFLHNGDEVDNWMGLDE
ncbi:hypothetical protein TNCV_1996821 [Trichonephila clavipes]|uniref:Uncharacterized protein n=1 Tax=Trichonephila clavipes TaxID=2585209 RepID=A0A8X6RLZ8_TRICX|nr:hypothetical protein TNCV_1996821 [Trichonephila clavipes]